MRKEPGYCDLDFEFNKSSEPGMGLISVTAFTPEDGTKVYWLRDSRHKAGFIKFLESIKTTHVLRGYAIHLAEARCVAALGLDPLEWKWRDLYAELRWLRNETNEYKYGKIVKGQFSYYTIPPARRKQKRMTDEELTEVEQLNAERIEEVQSEIDDENISMDEAGFSLLDALYYFELITLEQYREMALEKSEVRDKLIVTGTEVEIETFRERILDYNASDIKYMAQLADILTEKMTLVHEEPHMYLHNGENNCTEMIPPVEQIQLNLANWDARLAKYAQRGIPINKKRLDRFLEIVPKVTTEIKEAWNREHPEAPIYRVGFPETILGKRKTMALNSPYIKNEYTKDTLGVQHLIHNFCKESGIENWPKTRTGIYSADQKTLATFASGENLIKQLERHQGNLSTMKAFSVNKLGNIEALGYIGSDMRQRPDFGPHGTQTNRNAHKAKSFTLAMSHWIRVLLDPESGMAFVECDFAQEEVFISAVLSGDDLLKRAYLSADFYLAYAQLAGMYPKDLSIPSEDQRKEEWFRPYEKIRQISKTMCLSIQYGARSKSIAHAIATATKDPVDYEGAQDLFNEYHSTFSDQAYMHEQLRQGYQKHLGIQLQNGWRIGPDNPSILSLSNFPVQGTGSCILQEACKRIDAEDIVILATMHDSILAYCKDEHADAVGKCMQEKMIEASDFVLGEKGMKVGAPEIVRHGDYWLHGKGVRDWPRYSKYFENL
jgi:hypothetical protein